MCRHGGKYIYIKYICMMLLVFPCIMLCSCIKTESKNNSVITNYSDNHSIIVDIPELGKKGQRILFSKYCYIGGNQTEKSQVILASDANSDNLFAESTYLLIKTNESIISYDFGMCWPGTVASADVNIISADFDSDSQNELLVNFPINGNGATIAQVFEIDDDSIQLIQELNKEPASLYGSEEYESLFQCEFLKNRQMRIYNEDIGFSYEFDISYYSDDFFDSEGIAHSNTSHIFCSYIYNCSIDDEKENTVLTCKCAVLLNTDYIGTMEMMYSFDEKEEKLVLFNAKFNPKSKE